MEVTCGQRERRGAVVTLLPVQSPPCCRQFARQQQLRVQARALSAGMQSLPLCEHAAVRRPPPAAASSHPSPVACKRQRCNSRGIGEQPAAPTPAARSCVCTRSRAWAATSDEAAPQSSRSTHRRARRGESESQP